MRGARKISSVFSAADVATDAGSGAEGSSKDGKKGKDAREEADDGLLVHFLHPTSRVFIAKEKLSKYPYAFKVVGGTGQDGQQGELLMYAGSQRCVCALLWMSAHRA